MKTSQTVYWPEGKIVEGFPADNQPELPTGCEGDAVFNPVTNRLEMIACFIDGKRHRMIDAPPTKSE